MTTQSPDQAALNRAMIRWNLSKATLVAETGTALIYRVEQAGNAPAALKILKPNATANDRLSGKMLAWYCGDGAVTIFDGDADALFMEWFDGTPLGDVVRTGQDDEATLAYADVVARLHAPRGAPPQGLPSLRDRFTTLFKTDARTWPHTARDLYARSCGIAHKLFDKPSAIIPLHGDLHHDTIVSSPRGWLAIDPQGILGDPAYEVANAFLNPQGTAGLRTDPIRVANMADIFAQKLVYSRKRILGFAAAHAALAACWGIEDGRPIADQLAVLPVLLAAYDQA